MARVSSSRAAVALLAVALCLVAACSSGDSSAATTTTTTEAQVAPETVTATSVVPVGDPVNRFDLQVGDCFNRYESLDVTTRVPCDAPHHREVFHAENHPAPFGDPYPGDRQIEQFGLSMCYRHFEAFVGERYEVSSLEIGVITPTERNFTDARARYRGITCFLRDARGEPLVGTSRNSAL